MKRTEIQNFITETYSANAEYPFLKYPDFAVFRHANNKKWFAVVMDIPKNRLGIGGDEIVSVVNLKSDPVIAGSLRQEEGIFPAYHMNKEKWISVLLDGNVDAEKLKWLIDLSYDLTAPKIKKRKGKEENADIQKR